MKKIVVVFASALSILILLIIGSFPKLHQASGIVSNVYEGGIKDLVIELENHHNTFYINRGFENVLDSKMTSKILGEKITITYLNQWTLLDPFSKGSKSIIEIKNNHTTIYKKIKAFTF